MTKNKLLNELKSYQKIGVEYVYLSILGDTYNNRLMIKDYFTGENNKFSVKNGILYKDELGTDIEIDKIICVSEHNNLFNTNCDFGTDVELFFENDKGVVPSSYFGLDNEDNVVEDGFQVELHPDTVHGCREIVASYIASALFYSIDIARKKNCNVSFDIGKTITDDIWNAVGEDTKVFGCNPTLSVYENFNRPNGEKIKFRSAGGHIHLGLDINDDLDTNEEESDFIKLADIMVGALFVLIDRSKDNIKRRKYYGRAGEYRVKPYGYEYRVLSNYWLRSYTLWSLASAQLRFALSLVLKNKHYKELIDSVDEKKLRDCINNNDLKLAKEIFNEYEKFIKKHKLMSKGGINISNIDISKQFLFGKPWLFFKSDIYSVTKSWKDKIDGSGIGYERFIGNYYDKYAKVK